MKEGMKRNWRLIAAAAALVIGLAAFGMVAGCASGPPSYLYTPTTNVVSEVVVPKTNTVSVTNITERIVTTTNLVAAAEAGGQPNLVVTFTPVREGVISNYTTISFQTNRDLLVTYTVSTNASGLANAAGSVTNLFAPGFGGLVTKGLIGLLSLGAGTGGLFARKYKQEGDQMTVVAQTHKDMAEKTATAAGQIIQTYREVAQSTPQGAIVDAQLKSWMQQHQQAAGVIDIMSAAVNNNVDDAAAQSLARQVMAEAQRLTSANSQAKA